MTERPDYTKLVSFKCPEGLVCDVSERLETGALIYECEWAVDPSPSSMLINPGKKTQMVRVTCTECGESALFDKTKAVEYKFGGAAYGFSMYTGIDYDEFEHGDHLNCPFCGAPVIVLQKSNIPAGGCSVGEDGAMSASVLDTDKNELVLSCWDFYKTVDREYRTRMVVHPMEAYVFDGKKAYGLRAWRQSYGAGGYYAIYDKTWRQPIDWKYRWGENHSIYGLTPELIESSAVPNCKLCEYMDAEISFAVNPHIRHAVMYMCQYVKHPQIENLVTQGLTHFLEELFNEYTFEYERNNRKGYIKIAELDFTKTRPSQILGLNRVEFARMRREMWCLYCWRLYIACREHGEILSQADMSNIVSFGDTGGLEVVGRYLPFAKIVGYLYDQALAFGADGHQYDDPAVSFLMLRDYWNTCEKLGRDMTNARVLMPHDLAVAHDEAYKELEVKDDKEAAAKMKARAKALSRFSWEADGLTIRPAKSKAELVKEGKKLSHCVATYYHQVANGKSAIFFIRLAEHPNTPFFTLELDEEKLETRQNRGKRNCARTPEVEAFEKKWLKHIKQKEKRNAKRNNASKPAVAGA